MPRWPRSATTSTAGRSHWWNLLRSRLVLVRRPGGTHLLLNANHAAFDGFGCVRLLQSIARAYTGRGDPEPPVPLDEARDLDRLFEAPGDAARGRRLKMVADKVADLAARPARPAVDGGEDRPGYGFHHVALSGEQTSTLDDAAATVNDLLLTALHLTLARWNDDHGRPAGRIGVLVPVNLRPKEWREDVVTNVVLDARVVTTRDDRTSVARALDAVHAQTEAIKEGGGAAMIEVMGGWSSLPLWAKQPVAPLLWLSGNRFVDTAILSDLGELKQPPDFGSDAGAPEAAWFSAPVRMPGGLCVGAATVNNRLCLAFRYRRSLLDRAAAESFANLFLAELQRVAQC